MGKKGDRSLSARIVKNKKLQIIGSTGSLAILIPGSWIHDMGWNSKTRFTLEYLPHRKMIIATEAHGQEDSDIVVTAD